MAKTGPCGVEIGKDGVKRCSAHKKAKLELAEDLMNVLEPAPPYTPIKKTRLRCPVSGEVFEDDTTDF